ncbi:MAG: ExeM/NucH family extracellular endonuclease [Candidatus Delongbacteria bacterium]|nr:ExeM/NucH family extracellular endonuclease [Candidatus Cloacimonadota bacterium]MCB9473496.1 ExeM/NucH family extracellular endonuclease [Candidatus Delongbacteria bacterium]
MPSRPLSTLLVLSSVALLSCVSTSPKVPETAADGILRMTIPDIQGTRESSPVVGQTLETHGVVTLLLKKGEQPVGFVIQDQNGDGDPGTSDALFVDWDQTGGLPHVGDLLTVRGTVDEENGRTGLAHVGILDRKGDTPLPAAQPFRLGDDSSLEALEGMRVSHDGPLTVIDTYHLGRYGSAILCEGPRPFTAGSLPATVGQIDRSLASVILDDADLQQNPARIAWLGEQPMPRTGDLLPRVEGVLEPFKEGWHLQASAVLELQRGNPRPDSPSEVGGSLRVASFNVLNFFATPGGRGADSAEEITRQQAKLESALLALDADLYGLIEIQNDSGQALQKLVDALNGSRGEEVWRAVADPAEGLGSDAIKQAFVYRPASLELIGAARTDTDPIYSRPPLAITVKSRKDGQVLSVIVNHLKSKGCRGAEGEEKDQGQGCWNALRTRQAARLLEFVERVKQESGDPDVLLMGDLNAYLEEDPPRLLEQAGFENLLRRLPAETRYSYVYQGQSGVLDHALASTSLAPLVSGIGVWHINADECPLLDYNLEYKDPTIFKPDPFRSSDHDPVLIGLN